MAKKSNKTSHVLNLLTNRTGLSVDDLEQSVLPKEQAVKKPADAAPVAAAHVATRVETPTAASVSSVSEMIRINLERVERNERIGG